MKKIAVYPGSFDPITNGHVDIIKRGLRIFDELIVLVAYNPNKKSLFSVEERIEMIEEVIRDCKNVRVDCFKGLLVEYVKGVGASVILRGLRALSDFEYEFQLALMNRQLAPEIETFFIVTEAKYSYLSSRAVKEVFHFGGAIHDMVPPGVFRRLRERFPPVPGFRQA